MWRWVVIDWKQEEMEESVQAVGRLSPCLSTQTLGYRCVYLRTMHLGKLVVLRSGITHTHTHTAMLATTHSPPAWSHVWPIDTRGPGATARETEWVRVEGDRNCSALCWCIHCPLPSVITLCLPKEKYFHDAGLMNPPVLQVFIWWGAAAYADCSTAQEAIDMRCNPPPRLTPPTEVIICSLSSSAVEHQQSRCHASLWLLLNREH